MGTSRFPKKVCVCVCVIPMFAFIHASSIAESKLNHDSKHIKYSHDKAPKQNVGKLTQFDSISDYEI